MVQRCKACVSNACHFCLVDTLQCAAQRLLLLQTWPLCFTVNHDNYGYRKPINPLIEDLKACEQLYDKTLLLINSKAATRIEGLPS